MEQGCRFFKMGFIIHIQGAEGLLDGKGIAHPLVHDEAHRRIDGVLLLGPTGPQHLGGDTDLFRHQAGKIPVLQGIDLHQAADAAQLLDLFRIDIGWVAAHGFDHPAQLFKPGAMITDVTGVKSCVVYDIQAALREDVEFIAAHPMAGREVSGVQNSDERIFRDANYIVVPTEKNTPEAIEWCRSLGRILGFRHIAELTPEQHDEMIGFVSQLTHVIAVSLMTCSDNTHLVDYTGDSFRDLTRIAQINDAMWSELFLMNREPLLKQMDVFLAEVSRFRDMLAAGDREGMREKMRLSTQRRALFDKK